MISDGATFQRQGKTYRAVFSPNLCSCIGCRFYDIDCLTDPEIPDCCSIEQQKAVIFEEVEHGTE